MSIEKDKLEYLEYHYSKLLDSDHRSALHHLTSVAKVAEKIRTTRQCKGHRLSKINFDYIDPLKLETISMFHSIYPDIIQNDNEWEYAIELLNDDIIEKVLLYFKRCSVDGIETINETLLTDPAFHYYTVIRLADIRLHTDILMSDKILKELDIEHLLKLKKEYFTIINLTK